MGMPQYNYIDPSSLLEALDGDWGAVASLAQTYLTTSPDVWAKLQRGIVSANNKAVWHESHTLKGMAALLGALKLASLLTHMEQDARKEVLPSESDFHELVMCFNATTDEIVCCVENAMKI